MYVVCMDVVVNSFVFYTRALVHALLSLCCLWEDEISCNSNIVFYGVQFHMRKFVTPSYSWNHGWGHDKLVLLV